MVSPTQSAFNLGRKFGDNIPSTQEILRDYHKVKGSPRCALKVDIMKDYDIMEWGFILATLDAFAIPPRMINWIKSCILSPMFSIAVNGGLASYLGVGVALGKGIPCLPTYFSLLWRCCPILLMLN